MFLNPECKRLHPMETQTPPYEHSNTGPSFTTKMTTTSLDPQHSSIRPSSIAKHRKKVCDPTAAISKRFKTPLTGLLFLSIEVLQNFHRTVRERHGAILTLQTLPLLRFQLRGAGNNTSSLSGTMSLGDVVHYINVLLEHADAAHKILHLDIVA
ncbi:hypothetical protein K491DRAFT_43663 [Lophiostoma macrostomum CBS 122681]|uniref:Uncharacterized protein n=1 Tax=Lophiostoma macrostomum CBS 122681 TaxID=1314788 RepID=A0A6A6SZT3_9PLEO|nr:hypothetical protein K491DRAFT_43663 [Lophiostoma macrostomum CBS 122681]